MAERINPNRLQEIRTLYNEIGDSGHQSDAVKGLSITSQVLNRALKNEKKKVWNDLSKSEKDAMISLAKILIKRKNDLKEIDKGLGV